MIIVSNTSPIIALKSVDKLHLLEDIFQEVIIPRGVSEELFKGESNLQRVRDESWIKEKRVKDQLALEILALHRFEWVVSSHFGSCGTDAKENSPRRARRTRRMEFDELSKRVPGNWAQDCWSRPMSSAFNSFVLFVSFVVKPFCTSARGTSFSSRPFVAFTQAAKVSRHQDRQGILVFTLCVLRALGGESFCFARRRDWWNSLRYPLETARSRNSDLVPG